MDLFKLVGKISVDASSTSESLQSSAQGAQEVSGQVSNLGVVAAGVVAAVAAAVVAAGKAMMELVTDTAEHLDDVDKEAKNMNVGTDWYQEWAFIAERSGTDMSTIAKAVETMTQKVGDGSDATDLALQQLGISLEDAQSMAPSDLFELITTRLSEIEDPATKASIASDLMGGSWKSLGTVMDLTAEDIQDLKDTAHSLGAVMDEEDIEKGAAFEQAMLDWNTAVEGLQNALGVALIPAMTDFVNWCTATLVPTVNNIVSFLTAPIGEILGLTDGSTATGAVSVQYGYAYTLDDVLAMGEQGAAINLGVSSLLYNQLKVNENRRSEWEESHGYASGLDYVPYDEYPARLHTGEAVLTAEEAESWRASQGGQPLYIVQNIEAKPQNAAELAAVTTAAISRARWSKQ